MTDISTPDMYEATCMVKKAKLHKLKDIMVDELLNHERQIYPPLVATPIPAHMRIIRKRCAEVFSISYQFYSISNWKPGKNVFSHWIQDVKHEKSWRLKVRIEADNRGEMHVGCYVPWKASEHNSDDFAVYQLFVHDPHKSMFCAERTPIVQKLSINSEAVSGTKKLLSFRELESFTFSNSSLHITAS